MNIKHVKQFVSHTVAALIKHNYGYIKDMNSRQITGFHRGLVCEGGHAVYVLTKALGKN